MKPHVIVLNLKRSSDRRPLLEDQFKELDIDYTFWPGFDSHDMINMQMVAPIIKGVGIGRNLEKPEMAIIMSHVSALKHAEVMGYEEVIILEDDVVLCKDWFDRLDALSKLLSNHEDWEYVYLSGHSDYVTIPKYEEPTVIPAPQMVGAFSYLVNRRGIEKITKFACNFITTYDDMIMHKVISGKMNGYLYLPFMTYHNAKTSLIWGETSQNHSSRQYFKERIDG